MPDTVSPDCITCWARKLLTVSPVGATGAGVGVTGAGVVPGAGVGVTAGVGLVPVGLMYRGRMKVWPAMKVAMLVFSAESRL